MVTIGQELTTPSKDGSCGADFDLAASHLAARSMQTRVLWLCSTLCLAGIIILAACLANPYARGVPEAVPGFPGIISPG